MSGEQEYTCNFCGFTWESREPYNGCPECQHGRHTMSVPAKADLKSEVERLKVELNEAQAAAAVMRESLESCAKHFEEMEDVAWNDDSDITSETFLEAQQCVQSALSTTAGTAFLARMAEAEWLVKNAKVTLFPIEWHHRADAFLKGEGVKA
jgi:DNA-directed RNA polymerase subunit RPC12/RpoP